MEIQSMNMTLTEDDLNSLIQKILPRDQPVEDLRLAITPGGVAITGVYPLFINVQFETHWELGVEDNQVLTRLIHSKAIGVPANIFKSAIVKMIDDLAREEPWIRMNGDTVYVDVDACIAKHAFPARTHLQQIDCQAGQIVLVAGIKCILNGGQDL
jgi:hypothetical protein